MVNNFDIKQKFNFKFVLNILLASAVHHPGLCSFFLASNCYVPIEVTQLLFSFSFVSKVEMFDILFSIYVTFALKLVLVTKLVVFGISFSVYVTFGLKLFFVTKSIVFGILFSIYVIICIKICFLTKLLRLGIF